MIALDAKIDVGKQFWKDRLEIQAQGRRDNVGPFMRRYRDRSLSHSRARQPPMPLNGEGIAFSNRLPRPVRALVTGPRFLEEHHDQREDLAVTLSCA
jgi:hypothetical protein